MDDASARRRSGGQATIYDVAELAGVSPSTVSRALGKPGRISAKTVARIQAAADELHFRVNPMARALPTGRTNTLALVVADITNPMVFGIVRGAEKAAAAAGYTLVIAESQESGGAEAKAIERIMPGVDGVILATTRLSSERIAELAAGKPVVLINRAVAEVPSVLSDVEGGVRDLVAHLAGLGHRSITYLAGPASSWISGRRWDALREFAEPRGIAVAQLGPGAPTIEGGRELYGRASRAGAVVAFNDLMAIGLMQAAAENGTAVPGELSVAGFDDIFGSELITPALTTVRAELARAGERAVDQLLSVVLGDHRVLGDELLGTELVVRGSTGRAPA